MIARRGLYALIVTSVCSCQQLGSKLWEESRSNAASVVTLIADGDFNTESITEACNSLGHDRSLDFFEWITLTDSAQSMFLRQPFYALTFGRWEQMYDKADKMRWRASSCIKDKSGTILRIRDGADLHEQVLSGSNPLERRLMSGFVRILRISLTAPLLVSIYARSSVVPDEHTAPLLFQQMKRDFPHGYMEVMMRADPWFVYPNYLLYDPFVMETRPTYQTWRQSPEIRCSDATGKLRCAESHVE